MTEPAAAPPTPEQQAQIRAEALRAVRLLTESLEHEGTAVGEQDARDVVALLGRVQSAVQPLRAVAANLSAAGTLTVGGTAGLDSQEAFGRGTVSLSAPVALTAGTHHHVAVQDNAGATDAVTRVTARVSTSWNVAAPTGRDGDLELTSEDVPWLLREILFRFDDLAEQAPTMTPAEVFNSVVALLSLLLAALPLLSSR